MLTSKGKLQKSLVEKVKSHLVRSGYAVRRLKPAKFKCLLEDVLKVQSGTATLNYLIDLYYDRYLFRDDLQITTIKDSSKFYKTSQWKDVRKIVFNIFGYSCLCCGSKKNIQVDHVVPRSVSPELALKIKNLQPLCRECNSLKGTETIDYRDAEKHISRKRNLEYRRGLHKNT